MQLNLPQEVVVNDYHDFELMQNWLRGMGLDVYVTEVGFIDGRYHGVVHDDSQTQTQFVDARRQELEEEEY
jgi:hypothetical protein